MRDDHGPRADTAGHMPMVPIPETGRVYRHPRLVGPADADPSGRARLDAIARWLQDAAHADIDDAGIAGEGAWVVRRIALAVERFPEFGERLELATFCSAIGATVAERRTSIAGVAGAAVEAVAIWVHVDLERLTPRGFPERFLEIYAPSADGRRARSKLAHPPPPPDAEATEITFRTADVDVAGHVNHTVYFGLAEELVGDAIRAPLLAEAEYRSPADGGPATVLRHGPALWVADQAGAIHASVTLAATP